MNKEPAARQISYRFELVDGPVWEYTFYFDKRNHIIPEANQEIRSWTLLENQKCSHCPLNSEQNKQCPIARNLDRVVEDSKNAISCKDALVTVKTKDRTYSKNCPTQVGLHSLFGLIMASSGCPHMEWLRPLARFHLPFLQPEEALFRVLSVALLEQLFTNPSSAVQDCAEKVRARYIDVESVNHDFIKRIRTYCDGDADKNAIATLDVFVQLYQFQQSDNFESLKVFFDNN